MSFWVGLNIFFICLLVIILFSLNLSIILVSSFLIDLNELVRKLGLRATFNLKGTKRELNFKCLVRAWHSARCLTYCTVSDPHSLPCHRKGNFITCSSDINKYCQQSAEMQTISAFFHSTRPAKQSGNLYQPQANLFSEIPGGKGHAFVCHLSVFVHLGIWMALSFQYLLLLYVKLVTLTSDP